MSRVKYGNPFAMGNLSALMLARENDDLEYLKEWTRMAVKEHEAQMNIYSKAFESLIEVSKMSSKSAKEISDMLKEQYQSSKPKANNDETV